MQKICHLHEAHLLNLFITWALSFNKVGLIKNNVGSGQPTCTKHLLQYYKHLSSQCVAWIVIYYRRE